jgi:NhaA family Na+:H+ antiporter
MSSLASSRRTLFQRFVHSEVSGSLVLLACTVLALVWANSPWAESYVALSKTYLGLSWGDASFELSLQHWVNDLLMAVFFFVVGLEIKREIVVGELSSLRQAVLPVSAAVGGMVVPALAYALVNQGGPGATGWGVPMATDIAFALGLLALFGSRAPLGLKVFLTALAIADDIGAVLVIALFYTDEIRWGGLVAAAVLLALIAVVSRAGVRRPEIYIVLAVGVWGAVLVSGIHATVAGILVAMLVPVQARIDAVEFLQRSGDSLEDLRGRDLSRDSMLFEKEQLDSIESLHEAAGAMRPPGITLEHALHPVQAFVILPLFAFFNAGVPLREGFVDYLAHPISLGIFLGLFFGKQIGVVLFAWVAVRWGGSPLPAGVSWGQIWGASCLAGIGFTMSLFVGDLAFGGEELKAIAKIGVLVGSLASGICGYLLLRRFLPAAEKGVAT